MRGRGHPHPSPESQSRIKRPASTVPFVNRFTSAIVNSPLWSLPEGVQRHPAVPNQRGGLLGRLSRVSTQQRSDQIDPEPEVRNPQVLIGAVLVVVVVGNGHDHRRCSQALEMVQRHRTPE